MRSPSPGGSIEPRIRFDSRRQLAGRHPCPERLEERLVEPEALEDDCGLAIDVHQRALRTGDGSDDSYGARCTPTSVTIAPTSSAGVTSNAGFVAGKRVETSRGSRASIGMSAPLAALGSSVEVGATT